MKRPRAAGLAVLVALALCSPALAQSRGPDVIVGTLYSPTHWTGTGSVAGFQSYSIGTYSCNRGDKLLSWIASTPAHPAISQNLFRYTPQANGGSRFEQISQSWLKHGFTALQGTECAGDPGFPYALLTANPAGGVGLGWGASDPYSSSLNGGISSAGPKSNINATTGVFPYPLDWSAFPGGVQPAANTGNGSPDRRLKTADADLNTTTYPGARFFFEGQYIQFEDAGQGNRNNSASWVEGTLNTTTLDLTVTNATTREQAAIQAWGTLDAAVKTVPIDVPGDGRFWLAWRVTDNGNGTWSYEYAIQNLNSDRSGASFTVPFGAGSAPTSFDAHYVQYHSGEIWANTPWIQTNNAGKIIWATPANFANDPKTSALRWGTLYNFRFTASTAPVSGSVAIGLFKPGTAPYAGLNQMVITADIPGGGFVAGAPINDTCASAVPMYGTKIGFSTANATSSGPNECSAAIDNDIWFSYTVPLACSGSLSVDTTGSSFASRVAVYTACPGATPSAIACSASLPNVSFNATAGTTYLIRVGGASGASGDGVLSVTPACPTGACCNGSSQCQVVTATACADMCANGASASYGGDNSTCAAGCTTFAGACCNATTGACSSGSSGSCCASSGIYVGNGSVCSPTPCPGAGRCCNSSTGACTVVLQGACTGTWTSAGDCTAPCAGTGACCNNASGVCSMVFSSACGSGSTFNGAAACSPSPCPVGACCNNSSGVCTSSIQTACTAGSTWFAASCATNPCPQPPPPSNDACSAAIWLTDNVTVNGATNTATFSGADGNGGATCGSAGASADVWYKYLPATTASVNINTCGSYPGFDTVLSIHTGSCGSLALLGGTACNDDSYNGGNNACGANNYASGLTMTLNAGTIYYIRICGYNNGVGSFQLRAIGGGGTAPTPPPNDDCVNRQGVGVGAPIAFDTTNATTDGPTNTNCAVSGQVDKDIWYNYPAQTTGNLTVSLCGSSYDTRLAIYHTSLCAQINDTTLVGCNDDFACGGGTAQSQLTVPVVQGDSYTIRVGGKSGAGGPGTMLLTVVSTLGACCDSAGACHTLTQTDCTAASGSFQSLPSSCSPSPCPQPGACCNGTTCSTTLPAACAGNFQGAAVACGAAANPTTCCTANFNQVNGLSVQDIFDYLAAWFAGDPRADINGGGLAVQDIFAFFNIWFAGC